MTPLFQRGSKFKVPGSTFDIRFHRSRAQRSGDRTRKPSSTRNLELGTARGFLNPELETLNPEPRKERDGTTN
jgi:hypothetical protein